MNDPTISINDLTQPMCGLCGSTIFASRDDGAYFKPSFVCVCGAVGFAALACDLDEAEGNLLDYLKIPITDAEAGERPLGQSGMITGKPYGDTRKLEIRLQEFLAPYGYFVARTTFRAQLVLDEPGTWADRPEITSRFPMEEERHILWAVNATKPEESLPRDVSWKEQ